MEYSDGKALVTAENKGGYDTEDVIQLYIKDYSEEAVPNHTLCGFKRIFLKAGETKTFEIPISERAFTAVNDSGERKIFGSRFTLYAGVCQPDSLSTRLSGTESVSTEIIK